MAPPILIGLVVLGGVITLLYWVCRPVVSVEPDASLWQKADRVEVLIENYLAMVFKHGPDSDEAKAFRFGIDRRDGLLIKEEALKTFSLVADCVDNAWRQNQKTARKRRIA